MLLCKKALILILKAGHSSHINSRVVPQKWPYCLIKARLIFDDVNIFYLTIIFQRICFSILTENYVIIQMTK